MIPTIAKRLVFHIGGFDPFTPHEGARRRFVRELGRFERTWSASASVGPVNAGPDETSWPVVTTGPDWRVETDYRIVRWDDVIQRLSHQPVWRRAALGVAAFVDFVAGGALLRYLRTSWQYAAFFLYPFVVSAVLLTLAGLFGALVRYLSQSFWAGAVTGVAVGAALLFAAGRWLSITTLFDDWIFSYSYIHHGHSNLDARLERVAHEIVAAARDAKADEILVIGHSLGAVLAVDMLDRALKIDPRLGTAGTRVTFLSIGSSVLKIGLHRGATRFRAAVARLAAAPGVFWGDYQARSDVMNFCVADPVGEMGLARTASPVVRLVKIRNMLERAVYRRIRTRLFRLHCQFISGNDRRAPYDYFMLMCGPYSAEHQTMAPDGAMSMIAQNGGLLAPQPVPGPDAPVHAPPREARCG
ncbi:hypothetical protein [Chelatococcus reniformis]|uniref:Lipase n=1 Tax=Chelatococcus reniformis TaxID=1494448 RepID=A0A916UUL9_9HYPH|nr:hypothetical protein [Chelatococcus reniformis]GGC88434.1 hypothetical protein GCM10010994_52990 [Chelatococcus reniformis]